MPIFRAIAHYRGQTARKSIIKPFGSRFVPQRFWRGVLVVFAAVLLAHVLTWQFDLIGWQRDLLRCLPIALAAPGMAAMRRRLIEQLLKD